MSSYSSKTRIVFLDLPTEIQEKVDQIRKIYNPAGVKRGIAHITFKQDEDYLIDNSKFMEIVESQKFSPFKLKTAGIRFLGKNGRYLIYLSFEKNKKLFGAITKLSKILETHVDLASPEALSSTHWEQSSDFFVHVTIASGTDEKGIGKKLYQEIKPLGKDLENGIICKTLRICQWSRNHWKNVGKIALKN